MCPVCHFRLLTVPKKNPVECAICGIKGEIKVENGHIAVTFSEEEQKKSGLTVAGKLEHFLEVRENLKIAMAGRTWERYRRN